MKNLLINQKVVFNSCRLYTAGKDYKISIYLDVHRRLTYTEDNKIEQTRLRASKLPKHVKQIIIHL